MKKVYAWLEVMALAGAVAFMGCGFPYEPIRQPQPAGSSGSTVMREDRLFALNGGHQICNPSISQNETYFHGCMMFLNLGVMSVSTDYVKGWVTSITQHDRITIVDTANQVRWFIMKPSFIAGGTGQLQDPEWSNHNNYATFLGEVGRSGGAWGCVIRISDKMVLVVHKALGLYSTPFVWLPDSGNDVAPVVDAQPVSAPENDTATYSADSIISKESIASFFGTTQVKFAWALRTGAGIDIYYIDFNEEKPVVHHLPRPSGLAPHMACESPMISPDGRWVTYHVLDGDAAHSAWIQRLDPASVPIRLGPDSATLTEPHWWVSPYEPGNPIYVTYCNNRQFANPLSLDDEPGKYGYTFIRKVNLPGNLSITSMPADQLLGPQQVLVGIPLQGGRSRSGTYFATGYMKAYIYKFASVQL